MGSLSKSLRDQYLGVGFRAAGKVREEYYAWISSGYGVGCHRGHWLRCRVAHGRLGTQPRRCRNRQSKRPIGAGFQACTPRLSPGRQRWLSLLRAPVHSRSTSWRRRGFGERTATTCQARNETDTRFRPESCCPGSSLGSSSPRLFHSGKPERSERCSGLLPGSLRKCLRLRTRSLFSGVARCSSVERVQSRPSKRGHRDAF